MNIDSFVNSVSVSFQCSHADVERMLPPPPAVLAVLGHQLACAWLGALSLQLATCLAIHMNMITFVSSASFGDSVYISFNAVTEVGCMAPPHAAALAVLGHQLACARQLGAISLQLAGSVVAAPSRDAASRMPDAAATAVVRFLRHAGPALASSSHVT